MASIGVVVLRRRGTVLIPAIASLATVVVLSLCFYGTARFRLPLDVMLAFPAGGALGAAIEARRTAARPLA